MTKSYKNNQEIPDIEREDNLRKNYLFVIAIWDRYHKNKKKDKKDQRPAMLKTLGISQGDLNKIRGKGDIPRFKGQDKLAGIRDKEIKEWLKGDKLIPLLKNKSEEECEAEAEKICEAKEGDIIKGMADNDTLDCVDKLIYLLKYSKYIPKEQEKKEKWNKAKLTGILEMLEGLEVMDYYYCKDMELLEKLLAISKVKMKDLETVYRACELLQRKENKG